MDSHYLSLCAWGRSENKILLVISIFLGELSVNLKKLFRKSKKGSNYAFALYS